LKKFHNKLFHELINVMTINNKYMEKVHLTKNYKKYKWSRRTRVYILIMKILLKNLQSNEIMDLVNMKNLHIKAKCRLLCSLSYISQLKDIKLIPVLFELLEVNCTLIYDYFKWSNIKHYQNIEFFKHIIKNKELYLNNNTIKL